MPLKCKFYLKQLIGVFIFAIISSVDGLGEDNANEPLLLNSSEINVSYIEISQIIQFIDILQTFGQNKCEKQVRSYILNTINDFNNEIYVKIIITRQTSSFPISLNNSDDILFDKFRKILSRIKQLNNNSETNIQLEEQTVENQCRYYIVKDISNLDQQNFFILNSFSQLFIQFVQQNKLVNLKSKNSENNTSIYEYKQDDQNILGYSGINKYGSFEMEFDANNQQSQPQKQQLKSAQKKLVQNQIVNNIKHNINATRLLQFSKQPDRNKFCNDGFYRNNLDCIKCPFMAKKCNKQNYFEECAASNADLKSKCLCSEGEHLHYNQYEKNYSCQKILDLTNQGFSLCQEYEGLVSIKGHGSFCWRCTDTKYCKRCAFISNVEYTNISYNYSLFLVLQTFYYEYCELCNKSFFQANKFFGHMCSNSNTQCKQNSACLQCLDNGGCVQCNTNFTFYDKSMKRCHTLPLFLSYHNQEGNSVKNLYLDLECKTNEVYQLDFTNGIYYCNKKCDDNCLQCQDNKCKICNPSYFLSDNKCIQCNKQNCANCISQQNINECIISCKGILQIEGSSCILQKTCLDNQTLNSNSECIDCPQNCLSCEFNKKKNTIVCLQCDLNFELVSMSTKSNDECLDQCKTSQYRNSEFKCEDCGQGCVLCNKNKNCIQCDENKNYYTLDNLRLNLDSQAYQDYLNLISQIQIKFNKNNDKEFDSYLRESQCYKVCPENQFLNIFQNLTDYDNQIYSSKQIQYFLSKFDNLEQLFTYLLNSKCKDINFCSKANTFNEICQYCQDGYQLQENICIEYPKCDSEYFYLDLDQIKCLSCPQYCVKCYYSLNQKIPICTLCEKGAKLNNKVDQCELSGYSTSDEPNQKCKNKGCIKCIKNRLNDEICKKCDIKYELQNNVCIQLSEYYIYCPYGQYPSYDWQTLSLICISCNEFCLQCYKKDVYNPLQQPICIKCKDGYKVSPSELMCFSEGKNFNKCNPNQNLQNYQGIYFCENCAPQCLDGCYDFQPNYFCKKCSEGYKLEDRICIQECPNRYFFNKSKKTCQLCSTQFCAECDLNNQCTKCQIGYIIQNNQNPSQTICIPISEAQSLQQKYKIEQKIVLSCPNQSSYLISQDSCYCQNQEEIFNIDKCEFKPVNKLSDCPEGYFFDQDQFDCYPCPQDSFSKTPTCIKCLDSYNCLICNTGYYIENSDCLKCPDNCSTCSSSDKYQFRLQIYFLFS